MKTRFNVKNPSIFGKTLYFERICFVKYGSLGVVSGLQKLHQDYTYTNLPNTQDDGHRHASLIVSVATRALKSLVNNMTRGWFENFAVSSPGTVALVGILSLIGHTVVYVLESHNIREIIVSVLVCVILGVTFVAATTALLLHPAGEKETLSAMKSLFLFVTVSLMVVQGIGEVVEGMYWQSFLSVIFCYGWWNFVRTKLLPDDDNDDQDYTSLKSFRWMNWVVLGTVSISAFIEILWIIIWVAAGEPVKFLGILGAVLSVILVISVLMVVVAIEKIHLATFAEVAVTAEEEAEYNQNVNKGEEKDAYKSMD